MKTYAHYTLAIVAVLLVPVIPFLLFGEQLESYISEQLISNQHFSSAGWVSGVAIALLTVDIFLPIPSSVVCTVAGKVLGVFLGTLVCWVGLNLSALIGYSLASRFGWPFVKRFTRQETREQVQQTVDRWSLFTLAGFRPVPILAEASILLAGAYKVSPRKFWPPVLLGNLVVAISFVGLGKLAADNGWFSLAIPISICIPMALTLTWWLVWSKKSNTNS